MNAVTQQLAGGELTGITILVWTLLAAVLSIAGGAAAGMALAGKDLGNSLAAAMGALFGPVAAVPGVLIGLVVLALF